MTLTRLAAAVALATALMPMAVSATTEWVWHKTSDGSHPSGYEQEMLFLLNRARANPVTEANWLANTNEPEIADDRAYFGVVPLIAQNQIASFAQKPPLAFDRRLYKAARQHNLDLISRAEQAGYFDRGGAHDGQPELIEEYFNFTFGQSAGNVHPTAKSPVNTHAAFVIDWNNRQGESAFGMFINPGHRITKLSGNKDYASVGLAAESQLNDAVPMGQMVVTENYKFNYDFPTYEQYQDFIVGTVYEDLDGNGRYTAGEGVAGVRVEPSIGGFHAVTGDAGGYAIPMDASARGTAVITFSGGGISTQTVTRNLPASNVNTTESILVNLEVTGTGPLTSGNSGADAFLMQDVVDNTGYGPSYGGQNPTSVIVEFENVGVDYSLAAAGFDVNTTTEIEVLLNGTTTLGYLKRGASGVLAKLTRFSVTRGMQQPGINTVEFRNVQDSVWGVSRLKLRTELGDTVPLDLGASKDPAKLGYRYGTASNKSVVRASFEASGTADVRIKAEAFHNNRADKVGVYVNGQFVRYMNKGKAKRLELTTINVDSSLVNAGLNIIEFRQMLNLGRKWGITNMKVFER